MNYFFPIIICIILTITFHIILVRFFPQKKLFWKQVDYFWVSLGLIGVLGASYSIRKEYSVARQPWHEQSLKLVYEGLVNAIHWQYIYFGDSTGFDYDTFEDKIQAQKYIAAGEFFETQYQNFVQLREQIITNQQYKYLDSLANRQKTFLDTIDNDYVVETARSTDFYFNRVFEERYILEQLRDQSNRKSIDWIMLFVSPYLLAIAIAFRLTKVTAEIKEMRTTSALQ